MKTIKSIITPGFLAIALFLGVLAGSYQSVSAGAAYLALASSGSSVHLSVTADPNSAVQLYYYPTGTTYPVSAGTIGSTNYSGTFTTTVTSNYYNIQSGNSVYVMVNGSQSSVATWPTASSGNGQIYFTQSSLNVNANQTVSTQIYGGSGNYYVSSNSNANIATANVIGNTVNVTGVSQGTATISICTYTSTGCASLTVYVNNGWSGGSSLSLSQTSVTLQQGQTQSVTIYGSSGSYYVSNNPGSTVATASIVGNNTVLISAQNPGTVSYSICATSSSQSCASVLVTVTSYYGYNNGSNYGSTYNPYQYYQYSQYTQPQYYYQQQYVQPTYAYTQPTYTYTQPTTYVTQPTYTYAQQQGTPVSGVFLNQVPSTGIGFGLKMTLFSLGLLLWSLFGAYVLSKKGVTLDTLFSKVPSMNSGASSPSAAQSIAARFKEIQKQKKGL